MLNINIGLLGHVDSGKTALAKALSHTASTAAFDKSPQSQSRGITLDLGFSACEVSRDDSDDARQVLEDAQLEKVQCTVVDCPGHAPLIRTVVGGAQIIDAMILVIDATKGVQAQTAECLVLGEALAKPLVVVVNKVDAIQGGTAETKAAALATLKKKLQRTFLRTRWPTVDILEVAAAPRETDGDGGGVGAPRNVGAVLPRVLHAVDLSTLKAAKEREGELPERFHMLADHCFAVRGQGTVFTGTIVAGMVRVGDTVLVPELQTTRKVKGLQVFHEPVEYARSGDRVGLCVAQFDPASFERGALCSSAGRGQTLVSTSQLIAQVHKVRYHPFPCDTHTKFHITIGHATVMGTMRYFARPCTTTVSSTVVSSSGTAVEEAKSVFDPMVESAWVEELGDDAVASYAATNTSTGRTTAAIAGCPLPIVPGPQDFYAVLLLERPVLAATGNSMVAMRLDVERDNFCRIALAGTICYTFTGEIGGASSGPLVNTNSTTTTALADEKGAAWRRMPVVRYRSRTLRVDRVLDSRTCIADGVVSAEGHSNANVTASTSTITGKRNNPKAGKPPMETRQKSELFAEVQKFLRLKVVFEVGHSDGGNSDEDRDGSDTAAAVAQAKAAGSVMGIIDSSFGQTGKVKLIFEAPVFSDPSTTAAAAATTKGASGGVGGGAKRKKMKGSGDGEEATGDVFLRPGRILLILKKYPFALHSSLDQ